MANLFDKAKKSSTEKKVEKHEVVNLPSLEQDIIRMSKLNEQIAELTAERELIDSSLRTAGKEAMIKLYNSKKTFPGTLKIKAGKSWFQFITSDRYKKIDVDGFEALTKTYGKNIAEEITIYSFNTAILLKHMDHISDLLMNSKKLSQEEKDDLIVPQTSYTIKKGALKELFSFLKKKETSVETIIEDIQPVFSIKSVQVEE